MTDPAITRLAEFTKRLGETQRFYYSLGVYDGPAARKSIAALHADLTHVLAELEKTVNANELQRDNSGMHSAGAGQNGVAPSDDAREEDLRRPEARSEKRCFTYCGDDKCDCGLAEGISLERNSAARLADRAAQPRRDEEEG